MKISIHTVFLTCLCFFMMWFDPACKDLTSQIVLTCTLACITIDIMQPLEIIKELKKKPAQLVANPKAKFIKTRWVESPKYATDGSNGLDFYIPVDMPWESKILAPGECIKIPSGIKIELPAGWALVAMPRSGNGSRGLIVGATLIDSDYRGEIHLSVINASKEPIVIKSDTRIVQFCLINIPQLTLTEVTNEDTFTKTGRGENGFGHTGTC